MGALRSEHCHLNSVDIERCSNLAEVCAAWALPTLCHLTLGRRATAVVVCSRRADTLTALPVRYVTYIQCVSYREDSVGQGADTKAE